MEGSEGSTLLSPIAKAAPWRRGRAYSDYSRLPCAHSTVLGLRGVTQVMSPTPRLLQMGKLRLGQLWSRPRSQVEGGPEDCACAVSTSALLSHLTRLCVSVTWNVSAVSGMGTRDPHNLQECADTEISLPVMEEGF